MNPVLLAARHGDRLPPYAAIIAIILGMAAAPVSAQPAPASSSQASLPAAVTFATDVAPILYERCVSCHRPEGSAPFSLLSFADVRPRAKAIAAAVRRRAMPPWKPEPGYGEFVDARRLSDEQIAVIVRWAEQGAAFGDPAALPLPPAWTDRWQLGPPDLIVQMSDAYRLPPAGPDKLRNFVIPVPTQGQRHIKAWEFRTNNPRVVHHATIVIDPTQAARLMDQSDPEPGSEGLIPLSAQNPPGYFLGWTPGQRPYVVPDWMAWPLEEGSDLVVMLHLRPAGRWETVQASVGLYFSDTPPTRTPAMIRLNRQDIDIPPGEPHYKISDSYTLPVDVDAYSPTRTIWRRRSRDGRRCRTARRSGWCTSAIGTFIGRICIDTPVRFACRLEPGFPWNTRTTTQTVIAPIRIDRQVG